MAGHENAIYDLKKLEIHKDEEFAIYKISDYLYNLITEFPKEYNNIVLLCIGTDRSTGDSFAPMIGTLLSEKNINNNNFKILGTLQNPVHAKNLRSTLDGLKSDNSLIIAVDASLGDAKNIGKIKIVDGSIRPGAGVGKELPIVGDISITAVVNFDYINPYIILQSTRLGIVYDMSKIVSEAILEVLDRFEFSCSLVNAN